MIHIRGHVNDKDRLAYDGWKKDIRQILDHDAVNENA